MLQLYLLNKVKSIKLWQKFVIFAERKSKLAGNPDIKEGWPVGSGPKEPKKLFEFLNQTYSQSLSMA